MMDWGELVRIAEQAIDIIWPYWGMIVAGLTFAVVNRVVTFAIWKNPRWTAPIPRWVFIGRITRFLHPPLLGFFLGFIPGMPVPPSVDSTAGSVLYYVGAGILGQWLFEFLDDLAEARGHDLAIAGSSLLPIAWTTPPPTNAARQSAKKEDCG